MTPTQLKEAAQVMLAVATAQAECKHVQVQHRCNRHKEWTDTHDPVWDWCRSTYRIKPEPREWYLNLLDGRFYAVAPCRNNAIKVREVIEC